VSPAEQQLAASYWAVYCHPLQTDLRQALCAATAKTFRDITISEIYYKNQTGYF